MATENQIAANRSNAQACTGPKSAEGKAASSQNAVKTGLYAKSDVIATESREDYDTLIAEYHNRFHPETPEERCLVDDLIRSEWLGRRYMAAASAILDYDFTAYKTQDLGLAFIRRSEALNQRNYAHTLKQLQTIQADRAKSPAQPKPIIENAENEPLTQKLVSFPQLTDTPPVPPTQTASQSEDIQPIAA